MNRYMKVAAGVGAVAVGYYALKSMGGRKSAALANAAVVNPDLNKTAPGSKYDYHYPAPTRDAAKLPSTGPIASPARDTRAKAQAANTTVDASSSDIRLQPSTDHAHAELGVNNAPNKWAKHYDGRGAKARPVHIPEPGADVPEHTARVAKVARDMPVDTTAPSHVQETKTYMGEMLDKAESRLQEVQDDNFRGGASRDARYGSYSSTAARSSSGDDSRRVPYETREGTVRHMPSDLPGLMAEHASSAVSDASHALGEIKDALVGDKLRGHARVVDMDLDGGRRPVSTGTSFEERHDPSVGDRMKEVGGIISSHAALAKKNMAQGKDEARAVTASK